MSSRHSLRFTRRLSGVGRKTSEEIHKINNKIQILIQIKFLTINFKNCNFVWLIKAVGDVVEMHGAVIREETNLSTRIAWEIIKLLVNCLTSNVKISTLLSKRRDVEQEEINSWLWRSQHILRWCNKFDSARANFGATRWIPVSFTHWIVLELFGDCKRTSVSNGTAFNNNNNNLRSLTL